MGFKEHVPCPLNETLTIQKEKEYWAQREADDKKGDLIIVFLCIPLMILVIILLYKNIKDELS